MYLMFANCCLKFTLNCNTIYTNSWFNLVIYLNLLMYVTTKMLSYEISPRLPLSFESLLGWILDWNYIFQLFVVREERLWLTREF